MSMLSLVPRPSKKELEVTIMGRLRKMDEDEFSGLLETARYFWRRYRELVEAPDVPEDLAGAVRKAWASASGEFEEFEYDCEEVFDADKFEPKHRQTVTRIATEVANGETRPYAGFGVRFPTENAD